MYAEHALKKFLQYVPNLRAMTILNIQCGDGSILKLLRTMGCNNVSWNMHESTGYRPSNSPHPLPNPDVIIGVVTDFDNIPDADYMLIITNTKFPNTLSISHTPQINFRRRILSRLKFIQQYQDHVVCVVVPEKVNETIIQKNLLEPFTQKLTDLIFFQKSCYEQVDSILNQFEFITSDIDDRFLNNEGTRQCVRCKGQVKYTEERGKNYWKLVFRNVSTTEDPQKLFNTTFVLRPDQLFTSQFSGFKCESQYQAQKLLQHLQRYASIIKETQTTKNITKDIFKQVPKLTDC